MLGKGINGVVAGEDQDRREELPRANNVAHQEADVAVEGYREGGGEISVTPGVEWRSRAIISVILKPGS